MAIKVNLDAFKSAGPEPQWLNQLKVTIAMGKQFEQNGDAEKAANCYKTVLYYDPNDTETRIKLSKCYQKSLRPEQAVKHQRYAIQKDPQLFQTAENEASVNFELGNFESSLVAYNRLHKQKKTSHECSEGLQKVTEVMKNNLPVNGIINCLRQSMLKMIENDQFINKPTSCKIPSKIDKPERLWSSKFQEAYYLRNLKEHLEFYRNQLINTLQSNTNDKLICKHIQEAVETFETLKTHLYQQKPFYVLTCQLPKKRLVDRRNATDMVQLQTAKYVNTIVNHCLAGEIRPALRQAELAMEYMKRQGYRPLELVNALYEVVGLAIYLTNQDVPGWSSEQNDKRLLCILGSNVAGDDGHNNVYRESYFGPQGLNTRNALKTLTKRLKDAAKQSAYSVYLQYERIKCHLKLRDFVGMIPLAKHMYSDACALGSIAWQVNALMMAVLSESRLCDVVNCIKTLELIVPLSQTLGNKNVTEFLRKIWKLFAVDKLMVEELNHEDKRKLDLVDLMPDSETAQLLKNTLYRMDNLPTECRMPLLLGASSNIKCKVMRRDDRCNYESFLRDMKRLLRILQKP